MRGADLLSLDPVGALLSRVRAELAADFLPHRPIRISRAPGRLDVMGGIADYTGSLVCEALLDRAAAIALQRRDDRNVQVFSFNLYDAHRPFTFRIPLDALALHSIDSLRSEFNQPGRRWAGYLAGCLAILHHHGRIDLTDPSLRGMNLALLSTVPLGAGVSSSAAIEVAAMIGFMDELNVRDKDPMVLAGLCQEVENRVVGAPCGIMDQVSSCVGEEGTLLRLICQPHELQPPLRLPPGIRVVGINSNVKHNIGGGMYGRTRCAAFMGHRIILAKMREMGQAASAMMESDPMRGYLANLDADDYKKLFRAFLPEEIDGKTFLAKFGPTDDTATRVESDQVYHVVKATDHHVLEARRVRNFSGHLESAAALAVGSPQRKLALDKAGHLMYASHVSYSNDALLGAAECDLLVQLVRQRESAGLYGAKITGGGSGGTVAVLANEGTDAAISEIMAEYEKQTGRKPEAFLGSSPGAWAVGTVGLNSI
ncbi:MAG: GHMP kinase [Tepidisphaeraceae bacterium]